MTMLLDCASVYMYVLYHSDCSVYYNVPLVCTHTHTHSLLGQYIHVHMYSDKWWNAFVVHGLTICVWYLCNDSFVARNIFTFAVHMA